MPMKWCENPDCPRLGQIWMRAQQRYCCEECKAHASYKRNKFKKQNGVRPILLFCKWCGAPYYTHHGGYEFCSIDCLADWGKENLGEVRDARE